MCHELRVRRDLNRDPTNNEIEKGDQRDRDRHRTGQHFAWIGHGLSRAGDYREALEVDVEHAGGDGDTLKRAPLPL